MRKPYRVAVAGPGGLGAPSIREVLRLPEMELVGVLAYSPDKNGKDAGELVGVKPCGIKVTTDFDAFCKIDAEVVIFTGRDFGDWRSDAQILALLEAGKNVITPLPYHYLKARSVEVAAKFDAAGKKGGATLFGTGITPGFFNERLAMMLTGLTNDVTYIKFQEFFNAEPLAGALQTLQLFGFGSPKDVAEKNLMVAMLAENYLIEPIHYAADKLGIKIDRIERTPQLATTKTLIKTPAMDIQPGTVGCVSYSWTAYSKNKPFYTTEAYWFLGDGMRPEGCVGNDFWTVQIEGRPSLKVTVASQASYAENLYMRDNEPSPPGYLLTVITFVQAIPNVVAAPPGLMYPDMPQMHWKRDLRN